MSAGVIRLTDMRPVEIAHLVLVVEGDQHLAVTDWNIAWHARCLLPAPKGVQVFDLL
jgi:hypothetical protein